MGYTNTLIASPWPRAARVAQGAPLNIQHLKTFVAVVDSGSFSQAARRLGLSQPAVSMQVQALESDIGEALLDRKHRQVDLTEAGRILLPHARQMLAEAARVRAEIEGLSGEVTGSLRLALSTTPGDYIIPRLLGGFVRQYPHVSLNLMVDSTTEVVDEVEEGRADLGMVGAKVRGAKVHQEELGHDELIAISHPDNPLAARQHVTVAELAAEPWVARRDDSGTQSVLKDILADYGITLEALNAVVQLGTGEAVVNAVEGGLGVSVVSRYVADRALAAGLVAQVDVEGFPFRRPFYLITPKRSHSRATLAFADYLRAEVPTDARR